MNCQELVELVTDYFEGALSPADRRRFDEHLGRCDGCTTYLEQMRTTMKLVGRLTPEALSPEAEHGLLRAFRAWKAR